MAAPDHNQPDHVPTSTYRLQLNHKFRFGQATELASYLAELGIGDCYLSPILMAVPGSMHGYDVTNHSRLNPEIGTPEELRHLVKRLEQHGMGVIADVVPNHMSIADPSNEWWWDVLENGPSSRFAHYFDINWNPPKPDLANKVLFPFLGDQYGRVLEDQQITVRWCEQSGFSAHVYSKPLPLAARTWALILQPALGRMKERLGDSDESVLELESILTALSHMAPPDEKDEEKIRERRRERDVVKKRLTVLMEQSGAARQAIEHACCEINGVKGEARSFDRLERLLAQQSYRLCYWRVASDEINYRRFFDVNELAAIRVEDPEVFAAVHGFLFELVREGLIHGLRVDHPDGLFNPVEYFSRLQHGAREARGASRPFFIVSEKILAGDEQLRPDWEVEGTTGYDFLGALNALFVDRSHRRAFYRLYDSFTGWSPAYEDLVYESKKLILQTSMASELQFLAIKLDRISEQHRWSRDFTRASLRHVLRETIACFPIYRTYTTGDAAKVGGEDERHIRLAISRAKRRNPATDESIFDFLQYVLLLDDPEGIDEAQRWERRLFVMWFQQFTGPVMAKGVEDTAFYRQAPLASLNEVGSEFNHFGIPAGAFHALNARHLESWPNTMLATSTHDSKRSEDTRARINVLSEIPAEWYQAIRRWSGLNRRHKAELAGAEAPSAAEEYFFYENLAGVWPARELDQAGHEEVIGRMQAYMQKALREAKIHTSWINPNQEYEEAVARFVESVLAPSPDNEFLRDFREFAGTIMRAGMWNSLSQTVLKIASPGVPDFYQGSEIWDFTLVDPDNRRPVDYTARVCLLRKIREMGAGGIEGMLEQLMQDPSDGALKLYVIRQGLCVRKAHHELFREGDYVPLRLTGARQNHVVAFSRTRGRSSMIAVAGRFFMKLGADRRLPLGAAVWEDTRLLWRKGPGAARYREVFTNRILDVETRGEQWTLPLANVLTHLPVALLVAVPN
ncbi:MAG TPA: malto-oligosyltrehalose synthase [Bryobacteraceae bacterium]|nr:malto-oligosyltrehalose synthase [Bryobacteraceae bacterium]